MTCSAAATVRGGAFPFLEGGGRLGPFLVLVLLANRPFGLPVGTDDTATTMASYSTHGKLYPWRAALFGFDLLPTPWPLLAARGVVPLLDDADSPPPLTPLAAKRGAGLVSKR